MARLRFNGSDNELLSVLRRHIPDPKALFYPTGRNSRRSPQMLIRHAAFLREVFALQPNMSFTLSTLQAVMKRHTTEQVDWFTNTDAADRWRTLMVERIQKMCRHAIAGYRKNKSADWVVKVFGKEGGEADDFTENAANSTEEAEICADDEGEESAHDDGDSETKVASSSSSQAIQVGTHKSPCVVLVSTNWI